MKRRSFLQLCAAAVATRATSTAPRLICFGDSITVGAYSSTPDRAYVAIVARAMGYTLDNRAIGATTIADQVRLEILSADIRPPDIALFLTGYNDMRHATPLADYQASLAQAVAHLTANSATLFLGDCLRDTEEGYALFPPFDQGSDAAVTRFNAVIHAQPGVRQVGASAAFDPRNTIADLVHPNDAGHAQIAAAFLSVMQPRMYLPHV
jgi:lysophospholipase L1-like esterase